VTLSNQHTAAVRQLAEDNYLETNRQIERKRLELSRMARQQATLVEEIKSLEVTAKGFRDAAVAP
jgi:hypothetical protein